MQTDNIQLVTNLNTSPNSKNQTKYYKRQKKAGPRPQDGKPLEMDPIAINTDYNIIRGMYKTDDIVTPKGQIMQDSQLTDYTNNF